MSRWLFGALCLVTLGALQVAPAARVENAAALGGRCTADRECQQGLTCVDGDGPLAGQCSALCASEAGCHERFGERSMCIAADQCALSCDDDDGCPAGTGCNAYGFCEAPL